MTLLYIVNCVWAVDRFKRYGRAENFFGQWIGIDKSNKFQIKFILACKSWAWFVGVKVGVANFFFDQSIGFDEAKTFQLKFFI